MVTLNKARELALSFEDAMELPHFELTSFRINKKIFATMDEKENRMCLMLTPMDQSVFCAYDKAVMYPVPNKWGQKGATYVNLKKVRLSMLKDAMNQAYQSKNKKSKK